MNTFDDNKVSGEVNAPGQSGRCDKNLNLLIDEELFDNAAILLSETSVMDANAEGQRQLQVGIADGGRQLFHVSFGQSHKLARILFTGQETNQIQRRKSCLSSRRHEYQRGLVGRVLFDSLECRFVHGGHSRAIMFTRKSYMTV